MQLGMHVIERAALSKLATHGVEASEPGMGILDALRMVEGHLPEPPEGRPLVLVGLDALVRAVPGEATAVLQAVRTGLVEARRYFAWKQIPLVLLLDGRVEDLADGSGLHLWHGPRRWSLAPLLGTRFAAARPDARGWWWATQIG